MTTTPPPRQGIASEAVEPESGPLYDAIFWGISEDLDFASDCLGTIAQRAAKAAREHLEALAMRRVEAPDVGELVELLSDVRMVLRHGSSQSARMLLANIDTALERLTSQGGG